MSIGARGRFVHAKCADGNIVGGAGHLASKRRLSCQSGRMAMRGSRSSGTSEIVRLALDRPQTLA
jgi:hypothetical protein